MHALCMHTAKQSGAKRATPRRRQRPDRPTKKNQRKPQNQKEKQKGLGANPGHEPSQNSQNAFLRHARFLKRTDTLSTIA